ncbi:MAG: hypothetical protein HY688_04880 [Chloroflexi bacterium]|nr:hypothetical protein [Chloroflexota bacterium]
MSRRQAAWSLAVLVGAALLLAIAACAPASLAARAPAQDATSTPPLVIAPAAVPTPVAVPIDHSVVDPLLAQGSVWIKGNLIKLPPGVRLEGMVRLDCSRQARWCPSEVWTLSKGNSNIQVSVTDGIVVGETVDPSDPAAFAFLAPFVSPAGALLDAWSPAERGRFKPPSFQPGPPQPFPTQDPSTVKTMGLKDVREIELKGQRIPLPVGVCAMGGSLGDGDSGVVNPNPGYTFTLTKGQAFCGGQGTSWVQVFVRYPNDPVVVAQKKDPADPAAFDFLKPYVRQATLQELILWGFSPMYLYPERTATSTPR